ncbi:helix-turn-helix transcriptional regulator [Streptomyces sp. uw30]|uniref:helix-turn-helix domain-containing protein n=1 Tax=Streptomyces sp. uw30 TaxID=1828179 RepID=UPI002905C25A|nr:helix-turn-helix transcriptional regulator [Streptomyces sp. uw30]
MLEQPPAFGAELRRMRIAAGLTLAQLASSVHYSKGQLSKIETGQKRPSAELGSLCDATLDAHGALASLVPARPPGAAAVRPLKRDPVASETTGAVPRMDETPPRSPVPPSRRQVITVGAAAVLSVGPGEETTPPGIRPVSVSVSVSAPADSPAIGTEAVGEPLLDAYRALLAQYRRLGQVSPPAAVLPVVAEQTRALRTLAEGTGSRTGRELLALAARFAEFTGWLSQEANDDNAALRWTAHAVDLAAACGDRDLASYALVRRALITYYRGEADDTIALAEGALSGRLPPRIRGLAAQREAQGQALAGDHDACMRGLDRARALLSRDPGPAPGAPILGTTHVDDPVSMVTGWCLVDLGRPRAAADILDRECARLPTDAWRTQVRYGVRRALAHARAGEIDHACELTEQLLPLASSVSSATIATDLRRLSRTLSRHPRSRSYLAVSPRLTAVLTPAP